MSRGSRATDDAAVRSAPRPGCATTTARRRPERPRASQLESRSLRAGCEPGNVDLEVADHEPSERSHRAAGRGKPEHHGLKGEDDQQQRREVANRLDEERRSLGHQPIGGELSDSDQHADDRQQRQADHRQGQGVAKPVEEGFPDRRSRARDRIRRSEPRRADRETRSRCESPGAEGCC